MWTDLYAFSRCRSWRSYHYDLHYSFAALDRNSFDKILQETHAQFNRFAQKEEILNPNDNPLRSGLRELWNNINDYSTSFVFEL
jgi:hypothetical protein